MAPPKQETIGRNLIRDVHFWQKVHGLDGGVWGQLEEVVRPGINRAALSASSQVGVEGGDDGRRGILR